MFETVGQPIINIRFSQLDCSPCPSRSRCTRAKTEPRGLTIHPKPEYTALHSRRKVQHTPEFLKTYKLIYTWKPFQNIVS